MSESVALFRSCALRRLAGSIMRSESGEPSLVIGCYRQKMVHPLELSCLSRALILQPLERTDDIIVHLDELISSKRH